MSDIIAVAVGEPGLIEREAVFAVCIHGIGGPVQFADGIGIKSRIAGKSGV